MPHVSCRSSFANLRDVSADNYSRQLSTSSATHASTVQSRVFHKSVAFRFPPSAARTNCNNNYNYNYFSILSILSKVLHVSLLKRNKVALSWNSTLILSECSARSAGSLTFSEFSNQISSLYVIWTVRRKVISQIEYTRTETLSFTILHDPSRFFTILRDSSWFFVIPSSSTRRHADPHETLSLHCPTFSPTSTLDDAYLCPQSTPFATLTFTLSVPVSAFYMCERDCVLRSPLRTQSPYDEPFCFELQQEWVAR